MEKPWCNNNLELHFELSPTFNNDTSEAKLETFIYSYSYLQEFLADGDCHSEQKHTMKKVYSCIVLEDNFCPDL